MWYVSVISNDEYDFKTLKCKCDDVYEEVAINHASSHLKWRRSNIKSWMKDAGDTCFDKPIINYSNNKAE